MFNVTSRRRAIAIRPREQRASVEIHAIWPRLITRALNPGRRACEVDTLFDEITTSRLHDRTRFLKANVVGM